MISIKNNKLFKKIFSLLFLGIIFVTIIFTYVGVSLQKKSLSKLLYSEANNLAHSIIFVSSNALLMNDSKNLIKFSNEYFKSNENLKNLIISRPNNKLFFNIQEDVSRIDTLIDSVLINMQKEKETYELIYSPILQEEVFHYVYPIKIKNDILGWLHLSLDLKEHDSKVNNLYIQSVMLFFMLSFLSFLVSYYITRLIVDPITKLNETVSSITLDNLDIKAEDSRNDEIGELSKAFNKMTYQLDQAQKKLKSSNETLEQRVKQRTIELEVANKNLSEKSNELSELNKNLDSKVKYEINKRRKQEQMLLHQSRLAAMGEMVGNIAHQWRQPLNALSIIIQNIQLSYKIDKLTDDFMKKSVDDSLDLTLMMSKTIDDFRNFFEPTKNKTSISLNDIVYECVKIIGNSYENKNITLNIEKNLLSNIYIHKNELIQVILNLLNNAKDALNENNIKNPCVNINFFEDESTQSIHISDNAGGIPEEIINKIFEPYFSTKTKKNGTGLGLYICKSIIEKYSNGKLIVTNEKDGALFKIILEK